MLVLVMSVDGGKQGGDGNEHDDTGWGILKAGGGGAALMWAADMSAASGNARAAASFVAAAGGGAGGGGVDRMEEHVLRIASLKMLCASCCQHGYTRCTWIWVAKLLLHAYKGRRKAKCLCYDCLKSRGEAG